jgi:diaminopimelate epimerase
VVHSDFNLEFEKFHGASNDFIFIHNSFLSQFQKQTQLKDFVKFVCNRYQGVGADGVIFYQNSLQNLDLDGRNSKKSKHLKIEILIVNSDGSFAGTCGNALRCLGLKMLREQYWNGQNELPIYRLLPHCLVEECDSILLEEQFILQKTPFAVLTNANINSPLNAKVSVAMGKEVELKATPLVENSLIHFGNELDFLTPTFVALSNPHWVFISPIFKSFNRKMFEEFGKFAQAELRSKSLNGSVPLSNVGMLTLQGKNSVQWDLVVYERGAGLTECCGSGAVAARIALEFSDCVPLKSEEIYFQMSGGIVSISKSKLIDGQEGQRILTGPAQWVFNGNLTHPLDQ